MHCKPTLDVASVSSAAKGEINPTIVVLGCQHKVSLGLLHSIFQKKFGLLFALNTLTQCSGNPGWHLTLWLVNRDLESD